MALYFSTAEQGQGGGRAQRQIALGLQTRKCPATSRARLLRPGQSRRGSLEGRIYVTTYDGDWWRWTPQRCVLTTLTSIMTSR